MAPQNTSSQISEPVVEKRRRNPPRKVREVKDVKEVKRELTTDSKRKTKNKKNLNPKKKNKEQLKRRKIKVLSIRNIRQEQLIAAAEILRDPNHSIWQVQKSCHASIHRHYGKNVGACYIVEQIRSLRLCLLRRDWYHLCRLLSIIHPSPRYQYYYPILLKYAAIFLAHFDRNEFEKLTKTLVSHVDVEGVLKMCSSMTNTVFDNQCQEEDPAINIKEE